MSSVTLCCTGAEFSPSERREELLEVQLRHVVGYWLYRLRLKDSAESVISVVQRRIEREVWEGVPDFCRLQAQVLKR